MRANIFPKVTREGLLSQVTLNYLKHTFKLTASSGFLLKTYFRFTTAIQRLPFGQIASIWNIFCEEIQENYLNKLLSKNEHVLVKKAHKKKSLSGVVALWRNLEYVMSIFSAFLLNVSFGGIGEQLTRKSSVLSARKLLHHTAKVVLEPLIGMAYGDGQQTVRDHEGPCSFIKEIVIKTPFTRTKKLARYPKILAPY